MPNEPIRVAAEREIGAPPERVYGLLADYAVGHPSILPPAIRDLRVVSGGVGAGTVATAVVTLAGRSTPVTLRVAEPDPGRHLRETADENGAVTDFLVEPAPAGSRVRIAVAMPRAPGLRGLVEGLLVPRLFGPVLRDQLERIARAVAA